MTRWSKEKHRLKPELRCDDSFNLIHGLSGTDDRLLSSVIFRRQTTKNDGPPHEKSQILVGQVGNLPPIEDRPFIGSSKP